MTGAEFEASIAEMVGMGFSESEARRAMRQAFNNPHRAVDILFSGVGGDAEAEAEGGAGDGGGRDEWEEAGQDLEGEDGGGGTELGAGAGQAGGIIGGGGGDGGGTASAGGVSNSSSPLDFLRRTPHFTIMRQTVQMQPSLLPRLLQDLGRNNPEMLALINNNQAEFIELINEPVTQVL